MLVIIANLGEKRAWARRVTWGAVIAMAAIFLLVASILAAYSFSLSSGGGGLQGLSANTSLAALAFLALALMGGALLIPGARRLLARVLPLDPDSPVHVLGTLLFAAVVLGTVALQVLSNPMQAAGLAGSLTPWELVANEAPLALLGLFGVGLLVRRRLPAALARLGFPRPGLRQVLLGLLGAVVAVGAANLIETAGRHFQPQQARALDQVVQALFGHLTSLPAMLLLALTAGVGEELLFRGALQPRFRLLPTSMLFALVHTQYGLTYASLEVFSLGLGLGWLRMRWGLLTCITAHAAYDLASAALPSSVTLLPTLVAAAVALALGTWVWHSGPPPAVPPTPLPARPQAEGAAA